MKKVIRSKMKIWPLVVISMLFCSSAFSAVHIKSSSLNLDTDKVAHVIGMIDDQKAAEFLKEMVETHKVKGDRVIIIDSPGGIVSSGEFMIKMMELERLSGTRMVCVVVGDAFSMAFNLLSHCDVRLAARSSRLLFHKVRTFIMQPMTAKDLREEASRMDAADEPYRQFNSKVLKMMLPEYDRFADDEKMWSARELIGQGYLSDIVNSVVVDASK